MKNNVEDSDFYFGVMIIVYALNRPLLALFCGVAVIICFIERAKP